MLWVVVASVLLCSQPSAVVSPATYHDAWKYWRCSMQNTTCKVKNWCSTLKNRSKMPQREVKTTLNNKSLTCFWMSQDDTFMSVRLYVKIANLANSSFLNSVIHQVKTNISVPGWGQTPHWTDSPLGLGGWPLEGKVALLVTPQNAKTAIIQSRNKALPWVYFYFMWLATPKVHSQELT